MRLPSDAAWRDSTSSEQHKYIYKSGIDRPSATDQQTAMFHKVGTIPDFLSFNTTTTNRRFLLSMDVLLRSATINYFYVVRHFKSLKDWSQNMEILEQKIILNPFFQKQYYLPVEDFIPVQMAQELASTIRSEHEKNRMSEDDQVLGSPAFCNLDFLDEFHHSMLGKVEKLVGAPLIPTYIYGRIYQNGAILHPHRDRDVCEISVTLNLAASDPWGIWFENSTGEKTETILEPGSAAVYLGCDALHWREQFHGTEYIQIFLHFVLKDGERCYCR